MAVRKLSAIAAAGAISGTDTIVGVQAGTTDVQYTVTNMATAILTANNGVTAAAIMTTNQLVVGDDGARGVKTSNATITGAYTFSGNIVVSGSSFGLSGNFNAPLGTAGLRYKNVAATITDTTTGASTIATAYTDVWGGNTIASTNALTVTNYFGSYFNVPTAAANVTFTNAWALGADSIKIGTSNQVTITSSGVAAIPASLAIGGATIGGNALAATGSIQTSTQFNIGTSGFQTLLAGDMTNGITIQASASGQRAVGITNAAFIIPSTSFFGITNAADTRSLAAGSINLSLASAGVAQLGTTAANALGSLNLTNLTGTGTIIIGTGDAASSTGGALQVTGGASVAKRFWIPAISASAGLQTAVLCQSSGGEMIADSVACLASSARFKTLLGNAETGALDKIIRVPIHRWKYNRDADSVFPDNYYSEHIGPTAEDIEAIDSRLVGRDQEGKARSISTDQLLALAIQAIQEQQEQIEKLKKRRA